MPEKRTLKKASRDKRQGKSASTQAGNFVEEEMDHVRKGKHGAANSKQAIAIGLSKARKAGVKVPKKASKNAAPKKAAKKATKKATKKTAARKSTARKATKKRSR